MWPPEGKKVFYDLQEQQCLVSLFLGRFKNQQYKNISLLPISLTCSGESDSDVHGYTCWRALARVCLSQRMSILSLGALWERGDVIRASTSRKWSAGLLPKHLSDVCDLWAFKIIDVVNWLSEPPLLCNGLWYILCWARLTGNSGDWSPFNDPTDTILQNQKSLLGTGSARVFASSPSSLSGVPSALSSPVTNYFCFSLLRVCYSATSCLSATPQTLQRHTMPSCICASVGLSSSCSCFSKSWAIALWTNSYCSWDVTGEKKQNCWCAWILRWHQWVPLHRLYTQIKQRRNSNLYRVLERLWESIHLPSTQISCCLCR